MIADEPGFPRHSGRVLVVDPNGAALFFQGYLVADRPERGTFWMLPGGGAEEGETPRQAAARELREETGLAVAPHRLGPHIATTRGYADLGWARGMCQDDIFLHRITSRCVDVSGLDEAEQRTIVGHRWLTGEQIGQLQQPVWPLGIGLLLADILAGQIPDTPRVLPWHHPNHGPDREHQP